MAPWTRVTGVLREGPADPATIDSRLPLLDWTMVSPSQPIPSCNRSWIRRNSLIAFVLNALPTPTPSGKGPLLFCRGPTVAGPLNVRHFAEHPRETPEGEHCVFNAVQMARCLHIPLPDYARNGGWLWHTLLSSTFPTGFARTSSGFERSSAGQ